MSTTHSAPNRLTQIDGLRAIATLFVVLFHYTTRYDQKFGFAGLPPFEFAWGERGVQLFFVISGFVIFMSISAARQPIDFVVSRLTRLYPTYWVAVCLSWLALYWAQMPGSVRTGGELLANLTMIHGVFGIPSVDGVYWSLEVELIFYVWMLLLAASGLLRRTETVLLVWLAVSCLAAVGGAVAGLKLPYVVERFGLLKWIPWFALGMLVYRSDDPRSPVRLQALAVGLSVLAIGFSDGPASAVFAILAAAGVYLAARQRLAPLGSAPLVLLGAMSYPLYLVHEQIGWLLIHASQGRGWHPLLSIGLAIGVSLVLAYLLHRGVELPATRFLRQTWKQRQSLASSPLASSPDTRPVNPLSAQRRWAMGCAGVLLGLSLASMLGARLVALPARHNAAAVNSPDLALRGPSAGDAASRVLQSCEAPEGPVLVLLMLGDVNAASPLSLLPAGRTHYVITDGRCRPHKGTLTLEDGSSTASGVKAASLGERPETVVVIPLSMPGVTLQKWTRAGPEQARFKGLMDEVRAFGLKPSAVLWQHGETDEQAGVESRTYREGLQRLRTALNEGGVPAPLVVSTSTRCGTPGSGAVARAVQRTVVQTDPRGIHAGPDFDSLGNEFREDGCRLNAAGSIEAARRWHEHLQRLLIDGIRVAGNSARP